MSEGHISSTGGRSSSGTGTSPGGAVARLRGPGRFGAILLTVGVLGLGVLALAGQSGYALDPLLRERHRHLLLAVAATLPLLFANAWVAIYLLAMERQLRPWKGQYPELANRRRSLARRALVTVALATGSLIVAFLLGPAVLLGQVPWWSHGAAFWICALTQGAALILGWRALLADRRLRRALATSGP